MHSFNNSGAGINLERKMTSNFLEIGEKALLPKLWKFKVIKKNQEIHLSCNVCLFGFFLH